MTTNNPVWLSVTYAELPCECHVMLRISANNDPSLTVSIVHNHIERYDLKGNDTISDLQVQDEDTLLIVVRNDHHEIVACGLYEVSLESIKRLSLVLVCCVSSNIQIDQCAQRFLDRAAGRALDAACPVTTGDLVVAEVR